ncbi:MAG: flagellar assembly protein FliW [Deltaproteobacteria bacterium]|nr:flagellar assembly protein FliW [Deltaproteobacteria bacterium]
MSLPQRAQEPVLFDTIRFGALSVHEDKIIRFVQGLPGFKDMRRFIMIDHDAEGLFKWLQSVDNPAVAFLMTDPNTYRPGYTVPLKKSEAECLGVRDARNLVAMVMVCVSRDNEISLNLKGPVLFNSENMSAIQCIIDRDDYPSHFVIKGPAQGA